MKTKMQMSKENLSKKKTSTKVLLRREKTFCFVRSALSSTGSLRIVLVISY